MFSRMVSTRSCTKTATTPKRALPIGVVVSLRFREGFELDAPLSQLVHKLQGHDFAACESIQGTDDQGVSVTEVVLAGDPLRPVCDPGRFTVINEYAVRASRAQLGLLGLGILFAGTDPRIADDRHLCSYRRRHQKRYDRPCDDGVVSEQSFDYASMGVSAGPCCVVRNDRYLEFK